MLSNAMYLMSTHDLSEREDGRCHICLRSAKLTWEHVPPRSAFNGCDALWHRLVTPSRASGRAHMVRMRGGFRVQTLCADCNNGRCSSYAQAYVNFVRHLVESPRLFDGRGKARLVSVPSDTLFIAKQIATMILASEPIQFAEHHRNLRHFVLDKDAILSPPFEVYAFLVPDMPVAGTVTRMHGRVDTFAPGYGFMGGEISAFPFGIVYANEIGRGYGLETLTDVTRWFITKDNHRRLHDVTQLYCRMTGVESIQCGIGHPRQQPQIDYL